MEYFSPLNITMIVVLVGLYLFSRPFFSYREMLADAIVYTTDKLVEQKIADRKFHTERAALARDEFMRMDVLWIPLFYVSFAFVILLWIGFTIGMDAGSFVLIVSGLVAAIVTRACFNDHAPVWLSEWIIEMVTILQSEEAAKCNKRLKEIDARMDELVEKARGGVELTEAEEIESFRLVIEARELAQRAAMIKSSVNARQIYFDRKKENATQDKE